MAKVLWLADALRAEGVEVIEHGDWHNHAAPGAFEPFGVLWHHTAGSVTGPNNPHPSLDIVRWGRPDLAGPLAQALVDYYGVFHIISAGRCNHAGWSGGSGGIPEGDGNTMMVGWEIDYDGQTQSMSDAQYWASVKATAAVLRKFGRDASFVRGHRETSTSGKIDPSFVDLDAMRADVAAQLEGRGGPASPAGTAFVYGDTQRVAAVNADGGLTNYAHVPGSGVQLSDWGGATLTGRAFGYEHDGLQHVFARGDDTLRHWFQSADNDPGLDAWDTAGLVKSDPTGFAYGDQQHVFFRNPDGRLEHRFYDVGDDKLDGGVWGTATFVGNPYAFTHNEQQHVFARTEAGELVHWYWWPGINPTVDNWDVTSGVASDVTGFSYQGGQHHIFFRNSDNALEHRFFDDKADKLDGGVWAGGTFTGNPHAIVHGDQQHIFGRSEAGELRHWYWWPGIDPAHDNWGVTDNVAGDPAGLSTDGQHHVFYRAKDGTLGHAFVDDGSGDKAQDNWGGELAG